MARIFLALALLSVGLLVANVVVGLNVGDLNGMTATYLARQQTVRDLERKRSPNSDAALGEARRALAETTRQFQELRGRQNLHFLLGVLGALVGILINSISVTYFIGTGRWCQEVIDTYRLDKDSKNGLLARSKALKRKTFPWSLSAILLILTVATLGAASDPGANQAAAPTFVPWHRIIAILTTCFVGWSFLVQVGSVGANYEIINEILQRVHRIRVERGLDEPDSADVVVND